MSEQVIALNPSTDHASDGWHLQESASTVAAALTAKPIETRATIARLQGVDDKTAKRKRAASMLQRLRERAGELRNALDLHDPKVSHILRALSEGDQQELAELGVDVGYAWLDDIVVTLINGSPFVEIETVGPYATYHFDEIDVLDVRDEFLPADERAGMMLAGLFREVFRDCENMRMVALLDDMSNVVLSQERSDRYVVDIAGLLGRYGMILPGDVAGRDYLLLRESEYLATVDQLIERLRQVDVGVVETSFDGDVVFHPSNSFIEKLALDSRNRRQELRKRGIVIKKRGQPTCHALDAAAFLENPINQDILHVVILDKHYRSEQDKTYALLRALDIVVQERHHNAFFDAESLAPELITYTLCELLTEQVERFLGLLDHMDEWHRFDPDEYVTRNYGDRILSEDHGIINFVISQLEHLPVPEKSALLVADIGTGPNLYPPMLLAPYIADSGAIDLVEYGRSNRGYLQAALMQSSEERQGGPWNKFEELMIGAGGDVYSDCLERACAAANVVAGSIFSLPRNRYDIVSSYFVAESITVSRREFRLAIRSLASSVKPNGLLIVAHMIGSREYHAGEGTHFPSVELTTEDIEEAYRDADLSFALHVVGGDATDKARTGYEGMAVVVARQEVRDADHQGD